MINSIKAGLNVYLLGLIMLPLAAILTGCTIKAETTKQTEQTAPKKDVAVTTQTPGNKINRDPYSERDFDGDLDYPAPAPTIAASKITKAAFDKIKVGMTLEDVEQSLGEKGMLVSTMDVNGRKTQIYKWSSDNFSSYIDVTVEGGKVIEKKNKGLK